MFLEKNTMYRNKTVIAAVLYVSLCVCIIGGALITHPWYPLRIITGESSVGTWLSGMMLVTVAVLSMVLSMQKGIWPWTLFAVFFIYLALDERFMYHECLKERLLLTVRDMPVTAQWIGELPVMIGALAGFVIAAILFRNIANPGGKVLLISSIVCGSASAVIDILRSGVFWEDLLKLIAEACLVCVFIELIPLKIERQ